MKIGYSCCDGMTTTRLQLGALGRCFIVECHCQLNTRPATGLSWAPKLNPKAYNNYVISRYLTLPSFVVKAHNITGYLQRGNRLTATTRESAIILTCRNVGPQILLKIEAKQPVGYYACRLSLILYNHVPSVKGKSWPHQFRTFT